MLLNKPPGHEFIEEFLSVRGLPRSKVFDAQGNPHDALGCYNLSLIALKWEQAYKNDRVIAERIMIERNSGPAVKDERVRLSRLGEKSKAKLHTLAESFATELDKLMEKAHGAA